VAFMSMGESMAGAMEEAAEGMTGEEMTAEQKAEMEKGKQQMATKAAELTKRYEGILERHGVTAMMDDETPLPEDPAQRSAALAKLFANTDDIALLGELIALMRDVGDGKEATESPVKMPGEVTDYRIDGDRATAKAEGETLTFVKIDGRWYLMPEKQTPPAVA
jgi:hypothetical protein